MTAYALLWDQRFKVALLALVAAAAMLVRQQEKIASLGQALRDKPKVETRVETKTVQGPVRIVEKIITSPAGEKIVERVITRDVVVKDSTAAKVETPICPAPYKPRFFIGASANPFRSQDGQMLQIGYTVNGRLDLGYGHSINAPSTRHEIATRLRF